jgi:hypothetical protein
MHAHEQLARAPPRYYFRVNAALLAGNRDVLAQDEQRSPVGARSAPASPLLRREGGSGAPAAIEFPAKERPATPDDHTRAPTS